MQTLKTIILIGWPPEREEVPVHIREFWTYRDELTLHNGVLFKNQRLIIPKALRTEVTSRIHSSHLGIEACLRKARDLVFWPSMNAEIKESVTNCSICAEFQAKQQNQPMQSHEIPDRPWSRLSSDLFTLHNKEYIVLVDSYSDYVEVSQLKATTSTALIEFFKEQFSRHGIPDILMTDNGPQYTSREFTEFTREWEFKYLTSSPYHSRSNGKSESAFKIFLLTEYKKVYSSGGRKPRATSIGMLRHYPNWTLAKMSEWLGNVRRPGNHENASRNCQTGPTWFKLTAKRSAGTENTLDQG
ncbi:PREDICTED: uncharacterized protein K02A2.6-like [Acropora digitifera]|uniref:uncharacterized protein K02A2.6-like n=1 Tax=Acropora digitifera TaxID=70779 RepID=UPI00077A89CC|nr:PREDICTED: uncharacterized protein K02A2.6-like [Acropora digitifera]